MLRSAAVQYEAVIREAWRITWRFRSLWVLGLFAGSAGPSCSWTNRTGDTGTGRVIPNDDAERITEAITSWVTANLGLITAIAIAFAVIALVAVVVSLIAQGGLTRAGIEATQGGTPTLGAAWGAGLRFFWRYVGLALLTIGLVIAFAICAAIAGGILLLLGGAGDNAPTRIGVAVVLGIPLAIVGIIVVFAGLSTITFAQRAIAIEDVGPVAALGVGWRRFREHVGTCAVLWLLNLALGIAAGIAIVIMLVIVAIPLVAIGALLWYSGGFGGALVTWAVIAGVAFIILAAIVGAAAGTFFWHYWTIAYLRLVPPPRAAPA
jgi:hypothetical protein